MTPDLRSREIATLDGEDWSLVAWGDWGWAAQQDNRLVLLDAEGEMTEQHAGVGVSSSSDGTILLVGPTMELVSAERGSRDLGVSGNLVGPIVDAVFSPDGRFVAISGREQTAILSLDDPEPGPVAEFDLLSAHGMAWTSDDAYVLVPTQAGVLLLDVGTGQVSRILERFRILAVDAVPVSRS